MNRFRQFLIAANLQGNQRELGATLRRGLLGVGAWLRTSKDLAADLEGFGAIVDQHRREVETWIGPEAIVNGDGGPFDARDLRIYLALADRVDIPIVPAQEILRLTEEEFGCASGPVPIPDNAVTRRISAMAGRLLGGWREEMEGPPIDREALFEDVIERSMLAMDSVPEGWMVRSNLCGPSTLKALAGCGVAGPTVPEVRFGPDLEIGPGWVRSGNRRRVDLADPRFVRTAAEGSKDSENVFLARPWVTADRHMTCEDPHRADTPAAGKGTWPAEWRVFVENGRVRGVSFYYSWAGGVTQQNARIAVRVAAQAQKIADEAVRIGAWPRVMDIEFLRCNPRAESDPKAKAALDRFPRDGVSFSLDFIEGEGGLMLLEGGPAHGPFPGMGHSCGFTGMPDPDFGNCFSVDGVAFQTLPGINLIDPATWRAAGDPAGCVLAWSTVHALALADPELPADLPG